MSVSLATESSAESNGNSAESAVSDLKSQYADFEAFVHDTIGDLDVRRVALLRLEYQLEKERRRLSDHEAELLKLKANFENSCSEQVVANEVELAETRRELKKSRDALHEEQQKTRSLETENKALKQCLDQSKHQYDELVEKSNRQRADQTENANRNEELERELSALQSELDEARRELDRKAGLLLEADGVAGDAATNNDARVVELEEESKALEIELEQVRCRAAELSDTVANQERLLNEERERWGSDLRQLRMLVENALATEPRSPVPSPSSNEPPSSSTESHAAPDPVLDGVVQQFMQLQRDAAARRGRK